jgi:NADP-dependent 3-hydroxy acid dehydrogenase YdfG
MEGCKLKIVFSSSRASSGIGLSTAIALFDRGAQVALLPRSTDALQELTQKLPGSLPLAVDFQLEIGASGAGYCDPCVLQLGAKLYF